MAVPLLAAVTGAWEAPLVSGLERSAEVVVVRRCADLAELLAAAGAGHGRAALVSADLPRLDREALRRLGAAGVAVVGVTAAAGSAEAAERSRALHALGVLAHVAADAPAGEVAAAVTAAVAALGDPSDLEGQGTGASPAPRGAGWHAGGAAGPGAAGAGAAGPDAAGPGAAGAGPEALDADASAEGSSAAGRVVVVWGAPGAPGRTTVATALAAELAERTGSVLLVDADTWSASVAQVLGLLDESAAVAAACRAAAAGALTPQVLRRLAPQALPGLRVVTGLPRSSRWPELGPASLEALWDTGRRVAAWTVVDVGAPLEQDEELSFDTSAPRRNAAALTALEAADTVLAVGSADPVGLQRLVRSLQDLAEAVPTARPLVVVTRVRASAVGPSPRRRVLEALARYAGVHDPVLVPDDRPACDAALLAGRTLAEAAPSSPARAAIAALAASLLADRAAEEGGPAGGNAAGDGAGRAGGRAGGRGGGDGGSADGSARRRTPPRPRVRRGVRRWARMQR
ncbi:hypothetical protein [Quadrisphaera sp. DSM 44207]|uniref:nucleotide-binding protein n=1 Tax=Quadrisphaera sp. DSM 44207 TaxID=1881057 RepID=UPI00088B943B|nr:hypothetical protein [Quadrisphaera sp. DSM 44207]SDQ08771.1 Cellulose biosynthesis protein BcsQ [Quadrisphaera sp. DSM 44207]